METNSPRRLGRYQLLERIAVGGMAEVYKATAQGLSGFAKTVVVKRLLPQHQRDQELLTMFVDEARLLGRLRHPNIAEVYDIDHEGNEYFFALEYVDGVELRDLLEAKTTEPLPIDQALWITIELARALGYAHGLLDDDGGPLGIVHRDISPSNVLVSQAGAVKLVDFGVAKWRSQRSETRHGVLKGKVNYMSPEQCRGEPLDQRSDVFALGVLLYEMTVGGRPFAGSSDFETLKAIAEGHYIPPAGKTKGYPQPVDALCVSMLELNRERRPGDMGQVIKSIQAYAADVGLTLGAGPLAANARLARTRLEEAGSRAPLPPSGDLTDENESSRLPFDRTATAAGRFDGGNPDNDKSKLKQKLGAARFGLLAVAAGIAVVLLWFRPWQTARVPAGPSPILGSTAVVRLNDSPQAPLPTTVIPSVPSASSVKPSATRVRAPGTGRAKNVSTARPVALRAVPQQETAVPPPAPPPAVWDPDSPVPP